MAENADGQEKTEEPTAKRLQDARDKGQVPRSRELANFLILVISALYMMFLGSQMYGDIHAMATKGLSFDRDVAFDMAKALDWFLAQFIMGIYAILPLVLILVVVSILSNILLGGWNMTASSMAPKISKMNPIKGLGRMFSLKALVELFKALGKFSVVAATAFWFVWVSFAEITAIGSQDLMTGLAHAAELLAEGFLLVSLSLIVIAAVDVPFQLYEYNKQMKMTLQEIKDEYKQTEGNPEIKGRIRRLQREMSMRRMMAAVPEADVVITNPTHFSVALKYEQDQMRAPQVVAMGADFVALQIRTLANQHDIPVLEAPMLARALYYTADLDQEIPPNLYVAVVSIYQYIFALSANRAPAQAPDFSQLTLPDELVADPRISGQEG